MGALRDGDPITIGLVAHYVFCPRRSWLEAVGEVTDTYQMSAGEEAHLRTDDPSLAHAGERRAVEVRNEEWGYTGRCDTIRMVDGALEVIEYKATPVRRKAVVTEAMTIQLALQVAALRSMGHRVVGQGVYFTDHRCHVPVELHDGDFSHARQVVERTQKMLDAATAPPPLEDASRCRRCSHVGVCLPDERRLAPVTRRIRVADPDAQIVHLSTPGSRASLKTGRLLVRRGEETLGSFPMERVQGVVIHGNVDVSGALIRELLWRSLTVVWCSSRGKIVGWAHSARGPNGATRVAQHVASSKGRLDLAREFVGAKVSNQATLLRRNGSVPSTLARLRHLSRLSTRAGSIPELMGIEGDAAAAYWASFGSMLRADDGWPGVRTRRPAADPVNAALNYAYALLQADVIRAVVACGLDPHAGFLHSPGRNKPALVLDLAEEFRPVISDSVVIRSFNNGELSSSDFTSVLGSCSLRPAGRKALIAAHERRVESKIRHPVFGYQVSWRRAMEVQARMILGVLDGSQERYVGMRTR